MKQCRQILAVMLALVLCIGAIPALADTMYVQTDDGADLTLRDEVTNAAIGQIPCGTAVTPDIEKSTDQWAYVTYEGTSGFVLWRYLSRKAPDAAPQPAPEPQPEPAPADPVTPPEQPAEEGGFRISVIGAAVALTEDGAGEAAAAAGPAACARRGRPPGRWAPRMRRTSPRRLPRWITGSSTASGTISARA